LAYVMVIRAGIDPGDFRACVTLIELCEVAGKLGVPESRCVNLDGLLTHSRSSAAAAQERCSMASRSARRMSIRRWPRLRDT